MFEVEALSHLDGDGTTGDPAAHCERLTVRAKRAGDAAKLAQLNRVLSDPEQRERLFEALEGVEAGAQELAGTIGY